MKIKDIFKKVEDYNEIARMMGTDKASIYFSDIDNGVNLGGEHFDNYDIFRKHVQNEYFKELAEQILKSDSWDFDKEVTFRWKGGSVEFCAELTAY